jgi:hypothetical protein
VKREPKPIGDFVRRTLDDLGVRPPGKLDSLRVAWPRVVGKGMAERTTLAGYRDQCLTIRARSATLKYELESFHREKILEALRRELPDIVVTRLRIITGS